VGNINDIINYNAEYKIGTIITVNADEYDVQIKSTGATVSGLKAADGSSVFMKGNSVIVIKGGGSRNTLSIDCLSPYA
jgi:hypothetical protein